MQKYKEKNEEKIPAIPPCVYSGDPSDKTCAVCDGITMEENGKTVSCSTCPGYEVPPSEDEVEIEQAEPPVADETENEKIAVEQQAKISKNSGQSDVPANDEVKYVAQAKTVVIRAESGVTIEVNQPNKASRWYKFGYTEERLVPESANLDLEKQALWNDVNATVDDQAEEILDFLKNQ